MTRADDERLGREHAAFLASVLGHRAEPEDDDEPRHATPDELTAALGRAPERELTPDDLRTWRAPEPDDLEGEHEPSSPAGADDIAAFASALRRPRQG